GCGRAGAQDDVYDILRDFFRARLVRALVHLNRHVVGSFVLRPEQHLAEVVAYVGHGGLIADPPVRRDGGLIFVARGFYVFIPLGLQPLAVGGAGVPGVVRGLVRLAQIGDLLRDRLFIRHGLPPVGDGERRRLLRVLLLHAELRGRALLAFVALARLVSLYLQLGGILRLLVKAFFQFGTLLL